MFSDLEITEMNKSFRSPLIGEWVIHLDLSTAPLPGRPLMDFIPKEERIIKYQISEIQMVFIKDEKPMGLMKSKLISRPLKDKNIFLIDQNSIFNSVINPLGSLSEIPLDKCRVLSSLEVKYIMKQLEIIEKKES